MSNFAYDVINSESVTDDSYRASFNSIVGGTVQSGLGIMTLSSDWASQLMEDRIAMIMAGIDTSPAGQMMANADQVIYETDSTNQKTQVNAAEQGLHLDQSDISLVNQEREQSLQAGEGISNFFAAMNNATKQKLG